MANDVEESTRRHCFYVDETMKTPKGYIPSVVVEGEPGHSPMIGGDDQAEPWYWGMDIETARRVCVDANAKRGISEADAKAIVDSSITASIIESGEAEARQDRLDKLGYRSYKYV